jgi:hypothetical protein
VSCPSEPHSRPAAGVTWGRLGVLVMDIRGLRKPSLQWGSGVLPSIALVAGVLITGLHAQNRACNLATTDELQSVLGAKVTAFKGTSVSGSNAELCTGETPTATVLLRLAKRSPQGTGKEAKGAAMMKKMGGKVEVKTFGPITCSTLIPPPNLTQIGFNTTCSVEKNAEVAAIEVTAKDQKDMIAMEKLLVLAEKMAGRF